MKKKTLTPNQQAYKKELRRLKAAMRRMEKRGYVFDEPLYPIEPPKRITKAAIAKLREITPSEMYRRAKYVNPTTGEVIPGPAGKVLERKSRVKPARVKATISKFPSETDLVINNFARSINELVMLNNPRGGRTDATKRSHRILHELQAVKGEERVKLAKRIQDNALELNRLLDQAFVASDETVRDHATAEILSFITEMSYDLNVALNDISG